MKKFCCLCQKSLQELNVTNILYVMKGTLLSVKVLLEKHIFTSERIILNGSEYICQSCFKLLEQLENYLLKLQDIQNTILNTFKSSYDTFETTKDQQKILSFEETQNENVQALKECTSKTEEINTALPIQSNFICEECGKSFTQKIGLQRHLLLHKGISKYKCNICEKTFIHHSSYNFHIRSSHGEKQQFKCDQCDKNLISQSSLKRHRKVHTKEKKFSCEKCPKHFAERCNLLKHMNTHR